MRKQFLTNTEYEPTHAEQKIIEVMLNPNNRFLNVSEICETAEVSRTIYYAAMKKPEFVEFMKQASLDIIKQNLIPVVHAFAEEAKRGSFQHGKVMLEMADIYREKKEITGKDGGPVQVEVNPDLSNLTTEELKQLEKLLAKTEQEIAE